MVALTLWPEAACEDSAEVRLVKNEDLVQTLVADRADEPFRKGFCTTGSALP
jgi:hypothetical protein